MIRYCLPARTARNFPALIARRIVVGCTRKEAATSSGVKYTTAIRSESLTPATLAGRQRHVKR